LAFPVEEQGERRQRRIAIATDSKDEAEALRRTIAQQFPDLPTVAIHSGTTETEQGREFGVSLDLPWFDVVYGFFVGVLEPSQCRQMLGRIRPPVPRRLWCRQRGMLEGNTSFEPEAIKSRLMNFHKQTNILLDVAKALAGEDASDAQLLRVQSQLWDRDQQTWQNVHLDLFAKLVARQNYSLYHLAALFESELAAEGHIVLPFQDKARNQDGFNHRITKQKLAVEEADKIARAQEISYPEALRLKERPLSTEQQRYQVTKALLKAELPGLELTSEFLYQTITRDRRRTLNAFKLGWYLDHPDRTREKDCREWLIHLSRWAMNDLVYLPDLRTHSYQIEIIRQLGLFEIIALNDLGREYSTPCLEKLKRKALLLKERLKIAFNLTVTSKTAPMRLVQNLLGRVGLKLKKSRQTTDGTRYYRLDEELVNDKHRLAVRASLDRKWMETESSAGGWG
jgi:hypothetical protein